MSLQKFCAVLYMSLAATGVANADESDVTLWIGWFVTYSEPILASEKEHNIRHENWMAESLSRSEAQGSRPSSPPIGSSARALGTPRLGSYRRRVS